MSHPRERIAAVPLPHEGMNKIDTDILTRNRPWEILTMGFLIMFPRTNMVSKWIGLTPSKRDWEGVPSCRVTHAGESLLVGVAINISVAKSR